MKPEELRMRERAAKQPVEPGALVYVPDLKKRCKVLRVEGDFVWVDHEDWEEYVVHRLRVTVVSPDF